MARGTGGSNEELPARLDTLLSSAIRDRARDERALAEMFAAMRQDLEAFGRDLTSIKKMVQRPFQPILTVVNSKLAEVQEMVSYHHDQVFQRLESAAQSQSERVAQESRVVGKFVEEWGKYLDVRLNEEAVALRKQMGEAAQSTDGRLSRESAEIRRVLESFERKGSEDLGRHMGAGAARLTKLADDLRSQLTGAEEALRADVEVAQEAILDEIGESSEAVSEVLNEITSVVPKQIGESIAEGLKPFSKQVEKLAGKVDEASRLIADSTGRLEAIQNSLIGYLSERDERLERVRDQALIDLVERMSEALKGKAKAKIADALREGDQRRKDHRDAVRFREANEGMQIDSKRPEDRPKGWNETEAGAGSQPWLSDKE